MDKKKPADDVKGFEEFIEAEGDKSFMGKPVGGTKRESGFENFTFLTNDADRLQKLKNVLAEKLPFAARYEQGKQIIRNQEAELNELRSKIFVISDKQDSPYRKSLSLIIDSYFKPN